MIQSIDADKKIYVCVLRNIGFGFILQFSYTFSPIYLSFTLGFWFLNVVSRVFLCLSYHKMIQLFHYICFHSKLCDQTVIIDRLWRTFMLHILGVPFLFVIICSWWNVVGQIVGAENPVLMSAAEQIFGAGGKRMRPALVFLVSRATAEIVGLE